MLCRPAVLSKVFSTILFERHPPFVGVYHKLGEYDLNKLYRGRIRILHM